MVYSRTISGVPDLRLSIMRSGSFQNGNCHESRTLSEAERDHLAIAKKANFHSDRLTSERVHSRQDPTLVDQSLKADRRSDSH
jgi:hypothetical protein